MGVKASLTLGREEMPCVKWLVGLNNVSERLSLLRRWFLSIHGVWAPLKPYAYYILGGIRVSIERRIY